jgi:hypothetical protein
MKYKATNKEIKQGYHTIIQVGYCAIQRLLRHESPVAYTCGHYGWNYDVYDIDGIAIVTGYRGMPGIQADYNLTLEYEAKAEGVDHDGCRALIKEFIGRAIN